MTWPQIQGILNHPTTEHGALKPVLEGGADAPSDEERFRARWAGKGLRDDELAMKWQEFLTVEWHRGQMEAESPAVAPAEMARRCAEIERELVKGRPVKVR